MGKLNNILEGMASILKGMTLLSIFPPPYTPPIPETLRLYMRNDLTGEEKDAYALASDWQSVGDDIRKAMERVQHEKQE